MSILEPDLKVIMLIPVYNCEKILPALFERLFALNPKPSLFVFAENNSTDNTLEILGTFKGPKKIIRVWFRDDATASSPYEAIGQIRQLLLTFARRYDPDYAIFLDSDVFPPRILIDRLWSWQKDIVGGSYPRLFPQGVFLASKWATAKDNEYLLHPRIEKPLDEPWLTSAGCLCLSRKIIQDKRINFYPLLEGDISEDFGFCLKACEMGYKIYLDGTLNLTHLIPEKRPYKPWIMDESGKYLSFSYGES